MTAYYNEIDPFAAEWLRQLIAAGAIAPGDVDERSIEDVVPSDLMEYDQCHFFAGIGVWSYALRLAGWPDDRPVWTGSCPCQPFSAAGKGAGFGDERHLWPAFHHLIRQCRPFVVFGEQVANGGGLSWLDLVSSDMEGEGYAVGACSTVACGFGAPHKRQRLYWMGHANSQGLRPRSGIAGSQRSPGTAYGADPAGSGSAGRPGPVNGIWRDADWLYCRDGKWRPVEPGTFPLAHGAPARVGRLRGYGNTIVAAQAQAFIEAYIKTKGEQTGHDLC